MFEECELAGARVPMDPLYCEVRYAEAETGEWSLLRSASWASFSDELIDVDVESGDEEFSVYVSAREEVELTCVHVVLRHAFASEEQVLLNGYQSWTDTVERPPWERILGLNAAPRSVVEKYALAGGGDYSWVPNDAKRGHQHGFTYATFRRGEGAVLVGSLDETNGFTLIRTDAAKGEVKLVPECPARPIAPGERVLVCRFCIVRGNLGTCYDKWFALSGVKPRPVKPVIGYTSWYRHYGNIDERKLLADLEDARRLFVEEGLLGGASDAVADGAASGEFGSETPTQDVDFEKAAAAVRDGAAVRLFQIDDGFCKVGDWLDVDLRKFPTGLASLAGRIREAGFLPGIWVAPFVCEKESQLYRERPEWLLRDDEGNPIRTGCHWTGGYALDTLNVDVRTYVLEVLHAMTAEWGFGLLKVDFLYAACMRPHGGRNRGELMADAIDLIRTGVGDDVLLLGCGVPLASAFGKVDYCRIGCDAGLDWNGKPYMGFLNRERISTKNSLANTYYRAPLDGRAFGNDPDVFFLRSDVSLSQAKRDEVLFADAELGSVLLTSDDLGSWGEQQRQRYRMALSILLGGKR